MRTSAETLTRDGARNRSGIYKFINRVAVGLHLRPIEEGRLVVVTDLTAETAVLLEQGYDKVSTGTGWWKASETPMHAEERLLSSQSFTHPEEPEVVAIEVYKGRTLSGVTHHSQLVRQTFVDVEAYQVHAEKWGLEAGTTGSLADYHARLTTPGNSTE